MRYHQKSAQNGWQPAAERRQFVERLGHRVVAGGMARAGMPALDAEIGAV
jgi:hypothetical protein